MTRSYLLGCGAAVAAVVVVTAGGLLAPSSAAVRSDDPVVHGARALPEWRPFTGIRFYDVPSQRRYRAVKFSRAQGGRPAGKWTAVYSAGNSGDSCYEGREVNGLYKGTLYNLTPGPGPDQYKKTYTLSELQFGNVTYNVPAWFKKQARQRLNGNGICSAW